MTSMRDISKKTGLGIATISRYINKSGYVSKENGELIQRAIDELDYVPNRHAMAVFEAESSTIGLVFPSLVNPFLAQLSTLLGNTIQEAGYTSIFCFTEDNPQKERDALKLLKGYRVDGMMIFRPLNKDLIADLRFPVVSFETTISPDTVVVTADNFGGGQMACQHLYERGCRKLLHLMGPDNFEATQARASGFVDKAKELGLPCDLKTIQHDYELGDDFAYAVRSIDFAQYDGVFVFNDINCLLLISHLLQQGARIPEDIKVIGFDNAHITRLMKPAITTIDQQVNQLAQVSLSVLLAEINHQKTSKNAHIIPVRLVQGMTT